MRHVDQALVIDANICFASLFVTSRHSGLGKRP
jgi:hypothetical protein